MATRSIDAFAPWILSCVESILAGRVMTYGDVAEYVGAPSPRIAGRVLALDGGSVLCHRVLPADGSLAEHLYTEQRQRLLAEGVRFHGDASTSRLSAETETEGPRNHEPPTNRPPTTDHRPPT